MPDYVIYHSVKRCPRRARYRCDEPTLRLLLEETERNADAGSVYFREAAPIVDQGPEPRLPRFGSPRLVKETKE